MTKSEIRWAVFIASVQCILLALFQFLASLGVQVSAIPGAIIAWSSVPVIGFSAAFWELAGAPRRSTLTAVISMPVNITLMVMAYCLIRADIGGIGIELIFIFGPAIVICSAVLFLGWLAGVFIIRETKSGWKLKW